MTAALRALIAERLPTTVVRIGPPSRTGTGEQIGLFLYQVRESTTTAREQWTEERDPTGLVVRRTPGERCYELWYLVTAWADEPERELVMLDGVLHLIATDSLVPGVRLPEELARCRTPVTMALACAERPALSDQVQSRTGLDLVVTAPLPVRAAEMVASPPTELAVGVSTRAVPQRRTGALITEGPS